VKNEPLVSVIVIFLNAEKFIQEAIESVISQTYANWELILVDDGSTDDSTYIAQGYVLQDPDRVYYLQHPNHQNRGMSASRNLGIHHANGEYIAFLDADDMWLPQKLEYQVVTLDSQPESGMLYGNTLYWYSWTEERNGEGQDFMPELGIQPNQLIKPPKLLPLFLTGNAAVPCMCSILVRRSVAQEVGGFEEAFRGLYEDQAFYAKVCLHSPIYVSGACWDWYRQHQEASVAVATKSNQEASARLYFLNWLRSYLVEQRVENPQIAKAINRELWRLHYPDWLPKNQRLQHSIKWFKKWVLKVEERVVPNSIRWLWEH
jgi:glycosyltransferase involved in cell wall biosynthesis